jgi:hypothetical protein
MIQWIFSAIPVVGKVWTQSTSAALESVGTGYSGFLPVVAGNNYENAAVMLDSLCWHLGLQIVPDLEHMLTTNDPTDANDWMAVGPEWSDEVYGRNLNGELLDMHTGGTPSVTAAGLPIRSFGGDLDYSGPKYLPQDIYVPTDKDFTDWIKKTELDDGQGFPTRSVRMRLKYDEPTTNDLANQIAYDYYARFYHSFNFTFAATQVWQPSIYDDYAVYSQTLKNIDGNLVASAMTRVRSLQGNILPVAVRQAPGGFSTVIFRPFEVCPGIGFTCDCVLATVVTAGCGSNLEPGDEIQVWDITQDNFLMPPELLFNSVGFARYYKIQEDEYNRPPGLTGDCRWVVEKMACVEQPLEEEE